MGINGGEHLSKFGDENGEVNQICRDYWASLGQRFITFIQDFDNLEDKRKDEEKST